MSQIILSAFADEYTSSGEEQLDALRAFQIHYLELRHWNGINVSCLSEEEIGQIKRMTEHCGIGISAIGSPIGKIALDADWEEHFQTARRIFSFAAQLHTSYVRIFSFYPSQGKQITEEKDRVLDALGKLILLAREYGVTLCHENEAKIYGNTPQRCLELIRHFNGELKCVFDMGNFVLEGVNPFPEAYECLKEHIAYFHIKDALFQGAIVPPGKGEARIREILEAHRQFSKEDFFVSLEPHLQTFSGLNTLVGRTFENPCRYPDEKSAFADAVAKIKELI